MDRFSQSGNRATGIASSQRCVIEAGWLIDGSGGAPRADQRITVINGRIASVTSASQGGTPTEAGLDFGRSTILPALMDAHVHLAFSGTLDATVRRSQQQSSPEQRQAIIDDHLAMYRHYGVAAVRDAGDPWQAAMSARKPHMAPHVAATCWAWHRAGRYGGIIGRSLEKIELAHESWAAPLAGADHVKVIQSGINSLDHFGRSTAPQFTEEELRAMGTTASRMGLPLMVHANGEQPVAAAVAAGCRSIEHGYFMGKDNLQRMADLGIAWVPTAIPMAALTRPGVVDEHQTAVARQTLDHQLDQMAWGLRNGVTMALGTDAGAMGVDHGRAVAQEMALFVTAGMAIPQAVQCATLNTAQLMGLEKKGALRPGWFADWIAVPGPPEDLPESLNRIEAMCVRGEWIEIDGDGLRKMD